MYRQILDPVGDSLALTAIFAVLPLLTLFVLLGVLKMKAWMAALVSLAVAVVVAIVVYSMPVGQTLLSATEGAAFGFFPILWIVINAIWVYNLTVAPGTSTCCAARSRGSAPTCGSRRSSSPSASARCSRRSPVSARRSRSPASC